MRLIPNKMRGKDTLGYEWLEPVSYGYDHLGTLQSILCRTPLGDDFTIELVTIESSELDGLFMHYFVETFDEVECREQGHLFPIEQEGLCTRCRKDKGRSNYITT